MQKVVVVSALVALFSGAETDAAYPLISPVIRDRPLTPAEITNTGLTNITQKAMGIPNAGLGQPLYLEVLVTNGTAKVASNTWTFINFPTNSHASFMVSPLPTNTAAGVTNLLSYDPGDKYTDSKSKYFIASRTLLVPDIACDPFNPKGDYIIQAAVVLTNGLKLYATNTVYGSLYLGNGNLPMNSTGDGWCNFCHNAINAGQKMDAWGQTAHATAFARKISGSDGSAFKSTCVTCHVVGYDTTTGATNGGFDDIAAQVGWVFPTNLLAATLTNPGAASNNWNSMTNVLQNKSNVQCENCHGPAERHARNFGDLGGPFSIGISVSAGNCGFCHDKPTNHIKNYQWGQTLHGGRGAARPYANLTNWWGADALAGNLSYQYNGPYYRGVKSPKFGDVCGHCHSAQGFILDTDPDWARSTNDLTGLMALGTGYEGITCAACHDPHSVGMGDYQLRVFTNVVLMNGYTNTLGGDSLLCMQCHHDRSNGSAVDHMTLNDTNTYSPHDGVQGDLLIGQNAIEYGLDLPRSRHLNVLEGGCIECHMAETPTNGPAMNHVGAHTWMIAYTTNSTTYELTETCLPCHGEIDDFNFGGEDYDRNGVVEGVQNEIQGLLASMRLLLPYSNTTTHAISYGTTNSPSAKGWWKLSEKKAYYNYKYISNDGSSGVHNPKYAAAILQASIDDLRGGIDVDRNGLIDSWEMANFHHLGVDPNADPDGDLVPNKLEMAVGTDPNNPDTDGDNFTDGAELAAGTDPLSKLSTPASSTNTVSMLPAYELAFLASTQGKTQQFQSVDAMNGVWTALGTNFITSSNTWYYQFTSTRNTTQRFFRVTTTN